MLGCPTAGNPRLFVFFEGLIVNKSLNKLVLASVLRRAKSLRWFCPGNTPCDVPETPPALCLIGLIPAYAGICPVYSLVGRNKPVRATARTGVSGTLYKPCRSVMITALSNDDGIIGSFVNDSMFAVDTARPVACPVMP